MFGLTVQDVIDALNELSDFEKTMYVVDGQNKIVNTITKTHVMDKRLGNCVRITCAEINWGEGTIISTLEPVGCPRYPTTTKIDI